MSESRAVLITGCSSGIGRATAQRLARSGHVVYATARRLESIKDLDGCRTLALDVCDPDSMRAAVETVVAEQGAVGALVNNAGYEQAGAIESVTMPAVRRQFETNVFGLVDLTQLVLPGMRAQGWGRIVNVSSVGGRLTFPGGGYYHATKHALEALSDALRYEVAPFGIGVSIVEPGIIKTSFGEAASASHSETALETTYGPFNAAVAALTAAAFRPPLSMFGAGPDAVARVIEHAVTSRWPRSRYRVTIGARAMLVTRRLMPDRVFDLMLRGVFPAPRP